MRIQTTRDLQKMCGEINVERYWSKWPIKSNLT